MKKLVVVFSAMSIAAALCSCSALQSKKGADRSGMEDQISGLNQKIDELTHRVSVLQLAVDEHQRSIRSIEDSGSSAKSSPLQPSQRPPIKETEIAPAAPTRKQMPALAESPEAAYNRALAVYKSKNYAEAAPLFKTIAENHSKHELADNALYWAGESFYAQKDYKTAAETFKSLLQKYPEGGKASDAMLKLGYTYLALKDPVNAQAYLKKVIKQYPFTPAATKADELLKKIKT